MIFLIGLNFVFTALLLFIVIGLAGATEKQKTFNDEIVKANNANHLILTRQIRDSLQTKVNLQKVFLHVLEKEPEIYRNDIVVTRQAMRDAESELSQAQKMLSVIETQESFRAAAANEERVSPHA